MAILGRRARTAALVRDPARLPLTVRGFLSFYVADTSESAMSEELECVGLADRIGRSPHGLDTELSTTLNAGIDLSGGQGQRLATARFVLQLRFKSIAVIDEPTTALDRRGDDPPV